MHKPLKFFSVYPRSVLTRIIIILVLLVFPLNMFYLITTQYLSRVLSEQAKSNIEKVSSYYINDLENRMDATKAYLSQITTKNSDCSVILSQQQNASYTLSKYFLSQDFIQNSQLEYAGDIYYFYSPKLDDILVSRRASLTTDRQKISSLLRASAPLTGASNWGLQKIDDSYFIMYTLMNHGMYIGSFISLDSLSVELRHALEYNSCSVVIDTNKSIEKSDSNITSTTKLNNTDLYLHVIIDKEEVLKSMFLFQQLNVFIAFFYLSLIPILILAIKRMLIRPLRKISEALTRFKNGESDYRISKHDYAQEFIHINQDFNSMAEHIENLTIENYENQLTLKQIELENLQLTIRPHFLQNTFGMLYTLSQTNQSNRLGDFILYLSQYFRCIYHGINYLIPFEHELSLIKSYIDVIKMQYPGNIEITYDISPDAGGVLVPSLLIHNFVENAMSHALKRNKLLHITVKAVICDELAYFSISDDGIGIAPETLELINAGHSIEEGNRIHIGLRNSYQRLQIIYNGTAGMRIDSELDIGTTVTVWIPTT